MDTNKNAVKKLGIGIMAISIIYLSIYIFEMLLSMLSIISYETLAAESTAASTVIPSKLSYGISLVVGFLIATGSGLILAKRKLGMSLFYIGVLINLINNSINFGLTASSLSSLILPILLAYLLYRKWDVFKTDKIEDDNAISN